jgi:antitoxin ParD1/3/4
MATMNLSLPDAMREWVDNRVKGGEYSNASDSMRDLIRRDQQYRDRREVLVRASIEGEASGQSGLSHAEIWADVKARYRGTL